MTYEEINKVDAARRQLVTAIRIFFERKDPLAVHTIAAATQQILLDIRSSKVESLLIDNEIIRSEKRKEINRMFRETQNFLKHADEDKDKMLKYYPDFTPFFLLDATYLYEQITGDKLVEGIVLSGWFRVKYPELFSNSHFDKSIKNELETLLESLDPDNFELWLSALDANIL
jgi:hypothetical protein